MKILLFSADYWPDPGGIAAHVYYLSRALAERLMTLYAYCMKSLTLDMKFHNPL